MNNGRQAAARECLPDERIGWTRKVRVGGQKLYLTCNVYPDGRPGEIFLRSAQTGALVQAMLDQWAIAVSVQLQCGVPLCEVVRSFRHAKFDPCGPVAGDAGGIAWASSLVDYVVQALEQRYLGTPADKADPTPEGRPVTPPPKEKVAGRHSREGELLKASI